MRAGDVDRRHGRESARVRQRERERVAEARFLDRFGGATVALRHGKTMPSSSRAIFSARPGNL
jgi:hypothetical protein